MTDGVLRIESLRNLSAMIPPEFIEGSHTLTEAMLDIDKLTPPQILFLLEHTVREVTQYCEKNKVEILRKNTRELDERSSLENPHFAKVFGQVYTKAFREARDENCIG